MLHLPSPTPPLATFGRPRREARHAGIALVLVLVFLALATGLIIAFFTNATTEYASARSGADASSAKQLADSAVQAAMGSVREATTVQVSNAAGTGQVGAPWASQPGMIRTYDPATGSPLKYFKLYSSDSMVVGNATTPPPATFDASSTDVDIAWDKEPGLYSDLNSPVTGTDGKLLFPIVDPRVQVPAGSATLPVDGFSYSDTPPVSAGYASPQKIDGVVTTGGDTQRLPMPTRWLYVLADGTLHTAITTPGAATLPDGTITSVTVQPTVVNGVSSGPTTTNPVVGRIAYWTDDESCKVNVNTASEASNLGTVPSTDPTVWGCSFWDTPHFNSKIDQQFGRSQPARGEFQRYPGHPAGVSLKSVFPTLSSDQIFAMTPRYTSVGGSQDGRQPYTLVMAPLNTPTNRLYASLDDLIFDPSRNTASASENTNIIGSQNITMNMARFFLTASSRASELNLFGLPRIAMWPINVTDDTDHRNASDELIAFCSTVPGATNAANAPYPFYFQRSEPYSTTFDISIGRNKALLGYLDGLTKRNVPGLAGGGDFATKYGIDRPQILTEMFDYIRSTNVTDGTVNKPYAPPLGVTGNGQGIGAGEVLPSCVLAGDTSVLSPFADTQGFGKFERVANIGFQFCALGTNPTGVNGSQVLATQIGLRHAPPPGAPQWTLTNMPPINTTAVQAYFVMDWLQPGHSEVGDIPFNGGSSHAFKDAFYVEVDGLKNIWLTGSDGTQYNAGFPGDEAAPGTPSPTNAPLIMMPPENYAGTYPPSMRRGAETTIMEFSSMYSGKGPRKLGTATAGSTPTVLYQSFPFYSDLIPLKVGASGTGTMALTTTDPNTNIKHSITIRIYGCQNTGSYPPAKGDLIQTMTVNNLDGTFPIPIYTTRVMNGIGTGSATDRWALLTTNSISTSDVVLNPIPPNDPGHDVVQMLTLDQGDVRLMARNDVPIGTFKPHKSNAGTVDYGNSSTYVAATLRTGACQFYTASQYDHQASGKLNVNGTGTYNTSQQAPAIPSHLAVTGAVITLPGGVTLPGDWDNGIGNLPDGPWINQPDEGNIDTTLGNTPYFDYSHTVEASKVFFSPNRMMPSPGMFGSLPTGVKAGKPWQTLLFRPGPTSGTSVHPGAKAPADHYFLDLFWMPSVEPYAMSEPFATAGKINLNQQIVPFTYITRNTAMCAALSSERIGVMPISQSATYKSGTAQNPGSTQDSRLPVNLSPVNGALRNAREKFASGDIFRSASQVCETFLTPGGTNGYSWPNDTLARNQWYNMGGDFALVGDNVRERPYADLYNKITTKSNTYTVHYCAQALRKSVRSSDPTVFNIALGDQVVGEQRGATTFERYLDSSLIAQDPILADPTSGVPKSLDPSYRLRTVSTRVFTP